MKTEESSANPYSQSQLDMTELLRTVEGVLRGSDDGPSVDMAKKLLVAIREHQSEDSLQAQLGNLGFSPNNSRAAAFVFESSQELNAISDSVGITQSSSSGNMHQPQTPSKDVAFLVSRLGGAPAGPERETALSAIRNYTEANGSDELEAHLQQLSGPFRAYIEEQLSTETPEKPEVVRERIRNLQTRMRASSSNSDSMQGRPQSAIPSPLAAKSPSGIPSSGLRQPRQSGIVPSSQTSQSLRDRLARTTENTTRASALRARLEAVKQQSKK